MSATKNANLLLYLNLAGEVFYIIVHRMKSQTVKEEHQERVRNDIAVAICHTTVIQNLLKGSLQILNLKLSDVRILMDRIVHSSIMTVNAFSMEKLFELTLIATKYQYSVCQYPSDILLIGLNHLDTIRNTVTDTTAKTLAENLHNLLVDRFKDVDIQTMQTYRYMILSYLADVKLKMTNLIRLGLQKTSGEFVKQFPDSVKRAELTRPGLIEVYKCPDTDETDEVACVSGICGFICNCDGFDTPETMQMLSSSSDKRPIQINEANLKGSQVLTTRFLPPTDDDFKSEAPAMRHSLALNGDRGITLGLSIYDIPGNCDDGTAQNGESDKETDTSKVNEDTGKKKETNERQYLTGSPDLYATKGLDLCSVLLGCDPTSVDSVCGTSTDPTHNPAGDIPFVSASALGLESVSEHFPSMAFALPSKKTVEQQQLNLIKASSINVMRFDARSENKAALAAIAQDFFELEAEKPDGVESESYKSTIDELLDKFSFPEED